MAHDNDAAESPDSPPLARPKPAGLREFSLRAVLCGLFVAALMGASYPYVVLKLGFGPNVSVVAAILGYIVLGLVFTRLASLLGLRYRPYNRWENNIVQTAGTAAAQTAFMCVLLAAFDLLTEEKKVPFDLVLTPLKSFAWLTTAGLLGVMLAVPLRRHFIVEEKLPFADGLAAGETLIVCDSEGPAATRAALAMLAGIVASALLMTLVKGTHVFELLPPMLAVGTSVMASAGFGLELSLLAVGSGMLIGLRINLSMLLGAVVAYVIAPYALLHYEILPKVFKRSDVLNWIMWPATGMLVAGGLAALALRWRVLARAFKNLSSSAGSDDFPLRWAMAGAVVCAVALVVVQDTLLGQPAWITVVAILLSLPLALVGLRVLGETNWGPISALSNMMQGVFALLAFKNVITLDLSDLDACHCLSCDTDFTLDEVRDFIAKWSRVLSWVQLFPQS